MTDSALASTSPDTTLSGDDNARPDYRLSAEQLAIFNRDSIINLGTIFSEEEVYAVIQEFNNLLSSQNVAVKIIGESNSDASRSIMGWQHASPLLQNFSSDIRVIAPIQSIIGDDIVFHQTKYNPKAPYGKGEKWDPHRGITFWHYLDGVPDPMRMVSIFIALTEQTKENGATYTWLRAHNMTVEDLREETDFSGRGDSGYDADTSADLSLQIRPEMISRYDDMYEKIDLVGPAGTAWLLDSRNLHASQPNQSDAVRILVANVYRHLDNAPLHPRNDPALCATSAIPIAPYRGKLI